MRRGFEGRVVGVKEIPGNMRQVLDFLSIACYLYVVMLIMPCLREQSRFIQCSPRYAFGRLMLWSSNMMHACTVPPCSLRKPSNP